MKRGYVLSSVFGNSLRIETDSRGAFEGSKLGLGLESIFSSIHLEPLMEPTSLKGLARSENSFLELLKSLLCCAGSFE